MARIFRGHPFIVVPDVVTSLTREKVIVSEFVSGPASTTIKQLDQETRNRVGEIVFRFYFGCMYRHHQFSGDPHPGNFLLMDDGKVAFLDFGLFKVMPTELLEIELACQRAGHEDDGEELQRIWAETGFLPHPENFRPDKLLAQFRDATWWYVLDEDIELMPEIATQVMIDMSDPRSSHFGQMRHETLPADHLFGRRVETLTLAVLSPAARARQLAPDRARVDLRRRAGDRARACRGRVLRRHPPLTRGSRLAARSAGWRRRSLAALRRRHGDGGLSARAACASWVDDFGPRRRSRSSSSRPR